MNDAVEAFVTVPADVNAYDAVKAYDALNAGLVDVNIDPLTYEAVPNKLPVILGALNEPVTVKLLPDIVNEPVMDCVFLLICIHLASPAAVSSFGIKYQARDPELQMYVSPFSVGSGVLFDIIQTVPSANEPVLAPDDEATNEAESPVLVDVKLPTLILKLNVSPLVKLIVVPSDVADTIALGVLVAELAVPAFVAYDALVEPEAYEADWIELDPNGPQTFEAVTKDAVEAFVTVPADVNAYDAVNE
jgi:hypothetical protein